MLRQDLVDMRTLRRVLIVHHCPVELFNGRLALLGSQPVFEPRIRNGDGPGCDARAFARVVCTGNLNEDLSNQVFAF